MIIAYVEELLSEYSKDQNLKCPRKTEKVQVIQNKSHRVLSIRFQTSLPRFWKRLKLVLNWFNYGLSYVLFMIWITIGPESDS